MANPLAPDPAVPPHPGTPQASVLPLGPSPAAAPEPPNNSGVPAAPSAERATAPEPTGTTSDRTGSAEQLPDTHEHLLPGRADEFNDVLERLRTLAHPERIRPGSARGRSRRFVGSAGAWPAITVLAIIAVAFALWQRGLLQGDRLVIRGGQLDPTVFHDEGGGSGEQTARRPGQPVPLSQEQLGQAQFALARLGAYGADLAATLDALDSTIASARIAGNRSAACHRADSLLRQSALQATMLASARSEVSQVVGYTRHDWADSLAARATGAAPRARRACR